MMKPDDVVRDLRRYADLMAATLQNVPAATFPRETEETVQVERGGLLATAVAGTLAVDTEGVDRMVALTARPDLLSQISVVDAAGHARPVYRPLLLYAWLTSYRIAYESLAPSAFGRWDEALRPWCDLLEAELGRISVAERGTPALRGGSAAEAAWTALALHVAGKIFVRDAWTDLAADTFGRLARGQQASGAFLLASSSDNPELVWYHELAILNAAASYAVQAEERNLARAVARSTAFVQNEIEPDHATGQPWGVFAFIWNPAARPLADQLLHAISLRQPQLDGVSLILLADALYCVRLFTEPEPKS